MIENKIFIFESQLKLLKNNIRNSAYVYLLKVVVYDYF